MPDENQTDNLQTGSPEQIDATGPGVPTPPPASDEPTSGSEEAPTPATTSAPAATARAYHDIIAERLARKNPAAAARPMAHASDVENTPKPVPPPEMPIAQAEDAAIASDTLPAEIEQETKAQEIQAAEERPLSGSRERARLRQQERAELRRGGQRRASEGEEKALGESEMPENAEVPQEPAAPLKLERREQRQERERQERPREERPVREERQPRAERPQREARERPERQPREERPQQREQRPQREERRPEQKREARKVIDAKPVLQGLKGGEPKQSERDFESARALASKLGVSVVVPLYNEQDSLRELTAAVKQTLLGLAGPKYEIIYVNDGSTDKSGEILQDILATSSRVTVLTFRHNQGKSSGLAAGFSEAQYGIVITMDADLQDDPREFTNLIAKIAEGYDLVTGWKKKRHDPISKTGPSKFFNATTSFFSGIKLHDFNCGLKAYRKEVTDSLKVYGEMHRYLPALAHWQGFRVTEIPVVHHPRKFGKSKFGGSRFFKGYLDLITIVFTNRYGRRPLHLFGTIGTLLGVLGFAIDAWVVYGKFVEGIPLSQRPALLLGMLLILVGVQLISLGLLGEMIVKNSIDRTSVAYTKEKGRPSAEARERQASRAARMGRISGGRRPRPAGKQV